MELTENLRYDVDSKTIARVLGFENFNTSNAAILEIVKNAYDAGASFLTITFATDTIIFEDDGTGMSYEDLIGKWMQVGKSDKTDLHSNGGRIPSGSMGVGRFALAKLGEEVSIYSRKDNNSPVEWSTNWDNTTATVLDELDLSRGTRIQITKLRERWNDPKIDALIDFLNRTYKSAEMTITVKGGFGEKRIEPVFDEKLFPNHAYAKILLSFDAKSLLLRVSINSDEFSAQAEERIGKPLSTADFVLDKTALFSDTEAELAAKLGSFTSCLYFYVEHKGLVNIEPDVFSPSKSGFPKDLGIILFRNSFAISSFEGKRDWLELGKRSRKSPAATSHPTGAWRVRENNIIGEVNIDRKANSALKELSNRQGIEIDDYYAVFLKIIHEGIHQFELWRQGIVRRFVVQIEPPNSGALDEIKSYRDVMQLNAKDAAALYQRVSEYKKSVSKERDIYASQVQNLQYDVRMLQAISTVALKVISMGHELKAARNDIAYFMNKGIQRLDSLGLWHSLSIEDKSVFEQARDHAKNVVRFCDAMLNQIEKKSFQSKAQDLAAVLNKITSIWMQDVPWLRFRIDVQAPDDFVFAEDILFTIFDNLILNSVQQNEDSDILHIEISGRVDNNSLIRFTYQDHGRGLCNAFANEPFRILEPLVTSRENGHGLGMWIVNSSIVSTGGKILDIIGEQGFRLEFLLGDALWKKA